LKQSPKTKKAQATRLQIMEAALDLFQERGFDQTTMRDIAQKAKVALGAAYYYFKTKQELVLAFYADTQAAAEEHHRDSLVAQSRFKERMQDIVWYRLELLRPYRSFLSVLARHVDPSHAISPFSPETKDLRERSIKMIAEALEGSGLKPSKTIAPHLPHLLWLYQMGLVFFWLCDNSKDQQNTRRLLDISLKVLQTVIRMSKNPLLRATNKGIKELMEIIEANMS